jgi:acetyl esterase
MALDPQAQAVLDQLAALGIPDFTTLEPQAARQLSNVPPPSPPEVASVQDRTIPGPAGEIRIRVVTPEGRAPFPGLVYFHGGGFVICGLDSHEGVCRELANESGCVVVSVDYRMAPEARFPAAPEDCYAATRWVAENAGEVGIDASRLAVGGDSAGGNLAAVVSLMARDRGGPALRHQLLVYPVTDHSFSTASYQENAEGYMLTREMMKWFWGHYLGPDGDGAHAYASPLRAETLGGVPPAHLITAEFDPLRDEGEAYAERLRGAGVAVTGKRYAVVNMVFFSWSFAIDAGGAAISAAGGELRLALGR